MKRPAILFLLFAVSVLANTPLEQLMGSLQAKYDGLTSLQANFTQSYSSKRFSDRIMEKGVVYFQRGGFMRWEYRSPEKKIFTSDGRSFFYYVPADKQAIRMSAGSSDLRSPTLFLAGRGDFLKDFRAEWADPRPDSHLVKLTPVLGQPDFQYMIVEIDPVRSFIVRLIVVDAYDNRTEYKFEQIRENPSLPSGFFAFVPPPGTDIVYQREEGE